MPVWYRLRLLVALIFVLFGCSVSPVFNRSFHAFNLDSLSSIVSIVCRGVDVSTCEGLFFMTCVSATTSCVGVSSLDSVLLLYLRVRLAAENLSNWPSPKVVFVSGSSGL